MPDWFQTDVIYSHFKPKSCVGVSHWVYIVGWTYPLILTDINKVCVAAKKYVNIQWKRSKEKSFKVKMSDVLTLWTFWWMEKTFTLCLFVCSFRMGGDEKEKRLPRSDSHHTSQIHHHFAGHCSLSHGQIKLAVFHHRRPENRGLAGNQS